MNKARLDGHLQWENVASTQVLKVWELDGKPREAVYPQICVMRISNSDYLRFAHDHKGFKQFVNDHQIFSKKIIVAGPWVSLSSVDGKRVPPDWILTMVHGKMSTMIVSALPQLKREHHRKRK